MSMMNDYLINILHEQRAQDLMAEANQDRLAAEARGGAKPWWQRLFRPSARRPRRGTTIQVAQHRVAH